MSLFQLAGAAIIVPRSTPISYQGRAATAGEAPAGRTDAELTKTKALEGIAAFIPSEAIGIYIAGCGLFQPDGSAQKWALFGCSTAVIPLVFWLRFKESQIARSAEWDSRRAFWLFVFAVLAFTVWAAAMPQSPFADLHQKMNGIAAVAALFLSWFLPRLASVMGLRA